MLLDWGKKTIINALCNIEELIRQKILDPVFLVLFVNQAKRICYLSLLISWCPCSKYLTFVKDKTNLQL